MNFLLCVNTTDLENVPSRPTVQSYKCFTEVPHEELDSSYFRSKRHNLIFDRDNGSPIWLFIVPHRGKYKVIFYIDKILLQ